MSHGFADGDLGKIGKLCASDSTTVDDVLARDDLVSCLQMSRGVGVEISSVVAFVEGALSRLVALALCPPTAVNSPLSPEKMSDTHDTAPQKQQGLGSHHANATELITYFLRFSKQPREAVDRVVTMTIRVLGNGETLAPVVAHGFHGIIWEALRVDPFATAEAVAATLDESIVFGTIRNIASSFLVSEAVMGLFGWDQKDIHGLLPTSDPLVFTDAWIELRFPQRLVSYMPVALRAEGQLPYFCFLRDLIENGFSFGVGPMVDALLEYEVISGCVKDILLGCEEARRNPHVVPFASQGVEVFHATIALVRRSLLPIDTSEVYNTVVTQIAPLKCIQMYAVPFCNLVVLPVITAVTSHVDSLQVALCDMFVEVLKFQVRETDQIITEIGFLEKLLMLSLKYPESNRLSTLLHQSVLLIFAGEFNAVDRVILQHITAQETPPARGFLSACMNLCTNESYRHTSLSALMLDAWQILSPKVCSSEKLVPLWHVMGPLATHVSLQKRIEGMKIPVTGRGFSAVGSGCQEQIRHRPLVNHAGAPFSMSVRSLSSPLRDLPNCGDSEAQRAAAGAPRGSDAATEKDTNTEDEAFCGTEARFYKI